MATATTTCSSSRRCSTSNDRSCNSSGCGPIADNLAASIPKEVVMKRVHPLLVLFLSLLLAASAFGSGTLFGLRNPGDGGRQVIIVDPATGAVTPVSASISPPLPSPSGDNAVDPAGHRFFFIATPTGETDARIYTVDTQTGAVLSSPTITGSVTASVQSLDYDGGEGV